MTKSMEFVELINNLVFLLKLIFIWGFCIKMISAGIAITVLKDTQDILVAFWFYDSFPSPPTIDWDWVLGTRWKIEENSGTQLEFSFSSLSVHRAHNPHLLCSPLVCFFYVLSGLHDHNEYQATFRGCYSALLVVRCSEPKRKWGQGATQQWSTHPWEVLGLSFSTEKGKVTGSFMLFSFHILGRFLSSQIYTPTKLL